jgi:transglutaminase-like putative cysteine protease
MITCLLHHEQLNAEVGCTFTRIVLRLESMQAVQQLSQWRLDLNLVTQRLALHSLQVRRGEEVIEHADPAKVRVVAREKGLGAFVLQEHYTLLTLFENVRPGDCLELAYTLTQRPLLLPEHCHRVLLLPGNYAIDRYEWSVLHRPARGLRYLSSAAVGAPEIGQAGTGQQAGLLRWTWRGSLRERPAIEEQSPPWVLPDPWLQLSDLADWSVVASSVAAAWPAAKGEDALGEEIRRIEATSPTLTKRVEQALRLVQDHFRYLDVSLELDGQMPATPGEVLRRRYGDCKDLSLLLCHLLGRLGVTARPVLVNAKLGPRLPELLPSPSLFNHVVVEFTLEGETRWVDATVSSQGGGPLGRSLAPFGFGLPVGSATGTLCVPPAPDSSLGDIREIHETLLLDTRGASSILRFRQRLTGHYADALRRQKESAGAKEFQLGRTGFFAARYGDADNESPFDCDDDREQNVIRTIEVYRVRGFVTRTGGSSSCAVTLPASFALLALPIPATEDRRAPWVLPHPLKIEHTMEVMANGLPGGKQLGQTFADDGVILVLRRKFIRARWFQTISLTSQLSSLPAEDWKKHAELLEAANAQCSWKITTNAGLARPHRKHNFYEMLPVAPLSGQEPAATTTLSSEPDDSADADANPDATSAPENAPATRGASLKRRGIPVRTRKRRQPISQLVWVAVALAIAGACSAYYVKYYDSKGEEVAPETNELP